VIGIYSSFSLGDKHGTKGSCSAVVGAGSDHRQAVDDCDAWMTFALATWIMNDPNWVRFSVFAFFSASVFLPVLFKERTRDKAVSNVPVRQADGSE